MTTNYEPINEENYQGVQETLPNAVLILVLGIVSIIGCCCYGILGLILGIITLFLANSATKQYNEQPLRYTKSSYSNVQAGKVCAIIGIALSVILLAFYIYLIAVFGWAIFQDPSVLYDYYGIEMAM
ncbi:hypothetical protein LJB98_01500 [Bacteroidales bacterium OttesenSCG-928-M11]|nr:hypothetical protein [Bacteroidales bacterium OttesenSCG-928-M11]